MGGKIIYEAVMEQIKHFTCDCGDPWHGLQIYVDGEATDNIPVVCTVINENLGWADRLKAIWSILCGRLHILHEVFISRDEVNDFVDFVVSIKHNPNTTGGIPRLVADENGIPRSITPR